MGGGVLCLDGNTDRSGYNQYSEILQELTEQIEPGADNRETLKLAEQARKYLDKRMLYRVRVKSRVY